MHIGRPIRGQTKDFGPLLKLPCPDCDKDQWFHLKEHSSSMSLLGMQTGKHSSCSLHCQKCEFPVDLQPEDTEKAIHFLPITQKFLRNEIGQSDFMNELKNSGFAFLKEIKDANANWTCRNCGEESPLTFSACWNCGQENNPQLPQFRKSIGMRGLRKLFNMLYGPIIGGQVSKY